MKQSTKLLAALVAIPASVVIAGEVQAAEVTSTTTFEIKNDFVNSSATTIQPSTVTKEVNSLHILDDIIYYEMDKLTKGLTISYTVENENPTTGPKIANYKKDIEQIFNNLKDGINKDITIGSGTVDGTLLYGFFNNVHIKATETKKDNKIIAVKLELSFNYFADATTKKIIEDTKAEVKATIGTKTGLQKAKEVHDYLVMNSYSTPTAHSIAGFKQNGSSSHATALWTYILLKDLKEDVRYVSGKLNGKQHSWNLVEIDGKWYNLDVASDDNATKASKEIQYRNFLTTTGVREISIGKSANINTVSAYPDFEKVINPAQVGETLYYADAESNGAIYKLVIEPNSIVKTQITGVKAGFGNVLHHKLADKEYLYVINDAERNYLYQYDIANLAPKLIVQESIKSMSITDNKLSYILENGTQKSIELDKLATTDQTAANSVMALIKNLTNTSNTTQVLAARNAYNALTPSQKQLVNSAINTNENYSKLTTIENAIADKNTAAIATIIKNINALDYLQSSNFITNVQTIETAIVPLSATEKATIYNIAIYTDALKMVDEAKAVVNSIVELANQVNPFSTSAQFIIQMDQAYSKFDKLSTSLRAGFTNNILNFEGREISLEDYRTEINNKKVQVEALLAKYLYQDIESAEFLTKIVDLEPAYKALLTSQKALVTASQKAIIDGHISNYKMMMTQLTELKEYLQVLKVPKLTELTPALLEKAKKANALAKLLKPSQVSVLSTEEKTLIEEINNVMNIIELQEIIKSLDITSPLGTVSNAIARYEALDENGQLIIGINEYNKLKALLLDVKVRDVILKVSNLTDESIPTAIREARLAYDALTTEQKAEFPAGTYNDLLFYEKKLQVQMDEAKAQSQLIIDRINRITSSYTEAQVKDIRLAYNELSQLAKTYVTNVSQLLNAESSLIYQNTVVKEAKLQAAAFDEYMEKVNKNSTTAEIAKARAAYNKLSYETKRHVTMYEKLRRLETMWNNKDYTDLVITYYPNYINAIKPGGIEIKNPTYENLYIPDDSDTITSTKPGSSIAPFEEMTYLYGRYFTTLTPEQMKNVDDKNIMLKAKDIEILLPTNDVKKATGTVGVTVTNSNNELIIDFTEKYAAKYFSDYVEIRIPMNLLGGNTRNAISRVNGTELSPASYKVEGANYVIRTKYSGTFKITNYNVNYKDVEVASEKVALRELGRRGIMYPTTDLLVYPKKQLTRADAANLLVKALDIKSAKVSQYVDLGSTITTYQAQGLLESGIMSGLTNYYYNPNTTITRVEAAAIIANIYRYVNQDLTAAYSEKTTNFTDISGLSADARQNVLILEHFKVINTSKTRLFNPYQVITRGEFAEFLYDALRVIDFL